jgi:hypothetical protein
MPPPPPTSLTGGTVRARVTRPAGGRLERMNMVITTAASQRTELGGT